MPIHGQNLSIHHDTRNQSFGEMNVNLMKGEISLTNMMEELSANLIDVLQS